MKRAAAAILIAALLAGCAAPPKVGYAVIRSPLDLTEKQIASYALQENVVTIKAVEAGEGEKKKLTISAVLDRQDHNGLRIALLKRGQPGVSTSVTIKKFENTDIPSEITVKVDDMRADLIKKAGEVVLGVIKLAGLVAAAGPEDVTLPLTINLSQLIGGPDRRAVTRSSGGVAVAFGEVPPDAIDLGDPRLATSSSYFYFAACRTAKLSFQYLGKPYDYTFKVSDPNFLQRERMPVDGKITMHSQCGASVTGKMSGDDSSAALGIVAALVAQGQSIKDALEADDDSEE